MTKKTLVIHQGAVGDLILNFPALLSLKQEKQAFVALLCSSAPGKIAYELKIVDTHFSLENACFCSLFSQEMTPVVKVFLHDYDTIILISFSDSIEDHLRRNHSRRVYRIDPRPPVEEETHVALHIIEQLKAKGLLTKGVSPSCGQLIEQTQSVLKRNLIIIHPGAGSQRKRWPVEDLVQVATIIKDMNLGKVVFLVGPAEFDLVPFIRESSKGNFRVYEVDDLSHVIVLVRQALCFVGNDSGLTHLAAFMGVPTVAVFGPSNPKRWSPVGSVTKVLRGAADCAPCFEVKEENCIDPKCLSGISVDNVVDVVRELTRIS